MSMTAGIAGAGLMGRLLAFTLVRRGWQVTLFDRDTREGRASCAFTGAGMLAPHCELETCEPLIAHLGVASLEQWPVLADALGHPDLVDRSGSLVVAHPNDEAELQRLRARLEAQTDFGEVMEMVSGNRLSKLEPELAATFKRGLHFPYEGQVDNRRLLTALEKELSFNPDVTWHEQAEVTKLSPGCIHTPKDSRYFDWVFDCRGLGAKTDLQELRGVRGELIYLQAPEVQLNRPVRIMHPRYPLYIVPRPDRVYVVGATQIESEDQGPVTVQSLMELLSAAYAVHTGFSEARILDTHVNCRPAFPDNQPRISAGERMIRINGLYRHGFLIAPVLCDKVADYVENGALDPMMQEILHEEQECTSS